MATWYGIDDAGRLLAAWPGAPVENEELCGTLLSTARDQVLAYAPADADEEAPDVRLVYAQLQQARNLWAAGRADESGDIGTEGYSFVPRPLDKTIRGIIRPVRGDISAL